MNREKVRFHAITARVIILYVYIYLRGDDTTNRKRFVVRDVASKLVRTDAISASTVAFSDRLLARGN